MSKEEGKCQLCKVNRRNEENRKEVEIPKGMAAKKGGNGRKKRVVKTDNFGERQEE